MLPHSLTCCVCVEKQFTVHSTPLGSIDYTSHRSARKIGSVAVACATGESPSQLTLQFLARHRDPASWRTRTTTRPEPTLRRPCATSELNTTHVRDPLLRGGLAGERKDYVSLCALLNVHIEGSRTMRNRPYPVLKCSTFIFNVLCVGPGGVRSYCLSRQNTARRPRSRAAGGTRRRDAGRGSHPHISAVQRVSAAVNSEYGQTMCGDARGRASGVCTMSRGPPLISWGGAFLSMPLEACRCHGAHASPSSRALDT